MIAAEVLDTDYTEMRSYLRQFIRYAGKPTPQLWALHPYSDANRFRTIGTRTMLQTVPGTVWFTEVGGLYSYPPSFPPSTARQVRAVQADGQAGDQQPAHQAPLLLQLAGRRERSTPA